MTDLPESPFNDPAGPSNTASPSVAPPASEQSTATSTLPSTALLPDSNLFAWWASSASPQLAQIAFDILPIPEMSSEVERVIRGTKLTISLARNCLGEDIIEATESLNWWYKADLW